jgi:hypothetical protein
MSRYTIVRDFVKSRLDTVPGWTFITIPAGRAFIDRPEQYPGGTWSLDESDQTQERAFTGTYWRQREVSGYVLLYGNSDGVSLGDADAVAWSGVDLVMDAIDGQSVTGLPDGTVTSHLATGKAEPFAIDTGVFGVAIPIRCAMAWETNF